jgi:hypothetical protein
MLYNELSRKHKIRGLKANKNELFWILSYKNKTDVLKIILKDSDIKFNGTEIFNMLHMETSKDFMKTLLEDKRMYPLSLKQLPKCMTGKMLKLFLSDPRVYIDISNICKDSYTWEKIKIYTKDSLGGLNLMNNIYRAPKSLNYGNSVIEAECIYYRFLRYLVIKVPTLLDAIKWLTNTIKTYKYDTAQIIRQAANSVLNNKKRHLDTNSVEYSVSCERIYFAFRAFFLLSYNPGYTYIEILSIVSREGANDFILPTAAHLIAAKLGLKELMNQGLINDNRWKKKIKLPDIGY